MAATDSVLNIVIKAKNQAGPVLNNFNKQTDKTTQKVKQSSAALKLMGIAAAGAAVKFGVDAFKAASSFEKKMANVSTLVDTNTENMDLMKKSLLDLSREVPVALDDLTTSLYDIRSAGISANGAMDVLKQSAILATAGLGSTSEATDILTSAINAFQLESKDSAKWANVFFEAVKAGKTTVAELASGFGQVAPLANAVGVQFEELMGITSAMTVSGLDASVAYTQIRAVISNLLKPTKDMQELFDKLGISSINEKIAADGLVKTMRDLSDATEGNNTQLAKAFGSVEALNAVMMLNNETGDEAIKIISGMTDNISLMDEAFAKQQETAAANMQIFKNNVEILKVQIGTGLLPVINSVLKAWNEFLATSNQQSIQESSDIIKQTNEQLDELIDKSRKAGKDTTNLENQLRESKELQRAVKQPTGTDPRANMPFMEGITYDPSEGKPKPTFKSVFGGLFGYADGGVVPGPKGSSQLAVVHGGETVTPPEKQSGVIINFDLRGATMTDKDFINKVKMELNKSLNLNRSTN